MTYDFRSYNVIYIVCDLRTKIIGHYILIIRYALVMNSLLGIQTGTCIILRQLGGKNSLHRGTIPFWLYIVPTDLVNVFLDIGNLQITYKDLPTRFSSFFL